MLMRCYAERGAFRSFSELPPIRGRQAFRMLWHRNRSFELFFDPDDMTFRIPNLLPGVSASSALNKNFKAFVQSRSAKDLPLHRRIDSTRAQVSCRNRNGQISLTLKVCDADLAYGLQRLLHLVQETYLLFITEGIYFDYRVEQLGADPDWG